ncbi:MAG: alanine--glyoxylate aminotransferase family protein, partial [Chloroflexi bacterium]
TNTRGIDVEALNRFLRRHGMLISNGYGRLKGQGQTFRIAHMGDVTREEIEALLECIDEFIA